MDTQTAPLLRLENIWKRFAAAPVLRGVDFDVLPGEVHALAGENGAGKSTLVNIAGGVLSPDSGRIAWNGRPVVLRDPRAARRTGIAFVHQELALVPQLTAGENVFLGRLPARASWVRWDEVYSRAEALLSSLGCEIDPRALVGGLSIAVRQLVEIARALACEARLIVMDEPTAPLSGRETARLMDVIGRLRDRGVSIIYITHRLGEIYDCADRVTVLRDGERVASGTIAEMPEDAVIRHMVGQVPGLPARPERPGTRPTLRVEFPDARFELGRGEIVGLAGLAGSGRTELLEALFGVTPPPGGIFIEGRPAAIRSPRDAIRHGMALVPDDRKAKGLVLSASIRANLALPSARRFLIRKGAESEGARRIAAELRVRADDLERRVAELSGGNQQKIVLGKWLLAEAGIFLFDEPTRGVDVGAKAEMYALIRGLAGRGAVVLFASSELEEVLALADRILVMHRGRIAGELPAAGATGEKIMRLATGQG
ncbi:MAG: sugar ABC transporter ATP-binding protein [Acidobacteriia bacterium]|nr:sugar ABC transporter ATP-binding protein [Terriglobia bacterium]